MCDNAHTQDFKTALGARLGTYTSVSFTSYISEGRSYEVVAGITREANQSDLIFGGFYKFNVNLSSQIPTLTWYTAPGLYMNIEKLAEERKVSFAPSVLVGLEYTLEQTPVNFFLDLSPYYITGSFKKSEFNMHANLGVRYILTSSD
jgi:hypothetical protein